VWNRRIVCREKSHDGNANEDESARSGERLPRERHAPQIDAGADDHRSQRIAPVRAARSVSRAIRIDHATIVAPPLAAVNAGRHVGARWDAFASTPAPDEPIPCEHGSENVEEADDGASNRLFHGPARAVPAVEDLALERRLG